MKINNILNLFIDGLQYIAVSRTRRYLFGKGDDFKAFVERTGNVIFTLLMIRSKGRNVTIEVNGDYYDVTQYEAPINLQKVIVTGRVWPSTDSYLGPKVYVEQEEPECQFDYAGEQYIAELVSPSVVKKYFDDFNRDQGDSFKLNLVQIDFKQVTLQEFSCLVDGSRFSKYVEGAQYDEHVAYFNHVVTPFPNGMCRSYDLYSEEEFARWLVGVNG